MINRIHKIALVADDVEAAVEFYTKTLGLEVTERFPVEGDQDYVFLKAGDVTLELMPKKAMGVEPGFHHISFHVDSTDAATAELTGKGVSMDKEPFDVGTGGIRLAFFPGLDGVQLQLFERNSRNP